MKSSSRDCPGARPCEKVCIRAATASAGKGRLKNSAFEKRQTGSAGWARAPSRPAAWGSRRRARVVAALLLGFAELRPEARRLWKGHVLLRPRDRIGARPGDQLVDQIRSVGLGDEQRAVHVDGGRPVDVAGGGHLQAHSELVGSVRRPRLPGFDHAGGARKGPCHVYVRGVRGGDGPEDERRHHAEVAGAGASERPEQVLVVVLVTLEDAAVGKDELGSEQVRGGDAIPPAEDPKPTAERQTGHPD